MGADRGKRLRAGRPAAGGVPGGLLLGESSAHGLSLCGVGCGVIAEPQGPRPEGERRRRPSGQLRPLCSKGFRPRLHGSALKAASCIPPSATAARPGSRPRPCRPPVLRRHRQARPGLRGLYVSGQLLTDDYYAANKLMKGFIARANIDQNNSRLCMASAGVATSWRSAPTWCRLLQDLDLADLVVFSGHNVRVTHPVLFRRMEAARARGQRHVSSTPVAPTPLRLRPPPADRAADRRAAVERPAGRPDPQRRCRPRLHRAHVAGFDDVKAELAQADHSPSAVAAELRRGSRRPGELLSPVRRDARTRQPVLLGANQSAQGVAKGSAILNAPWPPAASASRAPALLDHRPPNAMGGRENRRDGHDAGRAHGLRRRGPARVGRFWGPTASPPPRA